MKKISKLNLLRHFMVVCLLSLIMNSIVVGNHQRKELAQRRFLNDPVISEMAWENVTESFEKGDDVTSRPLLFCKADCISNCNVNCDTNCEQNANCPGNC